MALDDPYGDPYALGPPPLAMPVEDPWAWVPSDWQQPEPQPLTIGPNAPIEESTGPVPAPVTATPVTIGEPRAPSVENVLGPPTAIDESPWPPPEWQPDATSSASAQAPIPVETALIGRADPSIERDDEIDMQRTGFDLLGNERAEAPAETDNERAARYARDPLAAVTDQQQWLRDREDHLRMRRDQELARDQWEREQNQIRMQEARVAARAEREKIAADAQDLASGKFGWATKSTGQKVAGLIAVIAGGLATARTGGPNLGLQMLEKQFEQDYNAKKAGIEMRRQMLGEKVADAGEDFRAAESHRIAAYETAIRGLETEAQQYDPQGRQFWELMQNVQQLRAQQARALQGAEDRAFSQAKSAADLQGKLLENEGKVYANELARRKAAGIGMGGKPTLTPDQLGQLHPGMPVPPVPMTVKDYTSWLDRTKKGQEVVAGAGASGLSKEALERTVRLPDGREFIGKGSAEELKTLRSRIGATETVVRLMDEALRIRSGWTSDLAKSDEWRQLQANWAAAIGVGKDVLGLGALSGPDMDLINKFIGTEDPTEFRDPSAGIKKARGNLLNLTRDAAKQYGAPADWTIKEPQLGPPTADKVDAAYNAVKKSQYGRTVLQGNPAGESFTEWAGEVGMGGGAVEVKRDLESSRDEASTKEALTSLHSAAIDAKATKDARDKALAHLKDLAAEHPTEEIRRLAFEQYNRALAAATAQKGTAGAAK